MPRVRKIAFLLSVCVLMSMTLSLSGTTGTVKNTQNSNEAGGSFSTENILKDETVYGMLSHDGSVDAVYVVNHFYVPSDGIYIDYGRYNRIESLSETVEPQITDDRIEWSLNQTTKDFYYKGLLSEKNLPWNFSLEYSLNGRSISGHELAGKKGEVKIDIKAEPAWEQDNYFVKNYSMQIQVPVNLKNSHIKSAEGATQVITGQTAVLTYMMLPNASINYSLVLESDSFEMDGISIGVSRAEYDSAINAGGFAEGFKSLGQGMEEMLEGTKEFKTGLNSLSQGIDELSSGLNSMASNGSELIKGMESYSAGINQLAGSVDSLVQGSENMADGMAAIGTEGGALVSGYGQMAEALKAQLPSEEEKAQLQYLALNAQSSDQTEAQIGLMAESMLEQISAVEQLYSSLQELNSGLSAYTSGVSEISSQYQSFNQGIAGMSEAIQGLSQGFGIVLEGNRQFVAGLNTINKGAGSLSKNTRRLPSDAQKLVEGQEEMLEGVKEAEYKISEILGDEDKNNEIKSFVSPGKGSANSVQFIMRTPGIAISEVKAELSVQAEIKKKTFIEKFVSLFN